MRPYEVYMKLLISLTDISFVATKSLGIFNVAMGLCKAFIKNPQINELHILGNSECANALPPLPPHVHLHLADKAPPRRFARIYWDQWGIQEAIKKIKPDWALLPKGFVPYFRSIGNCKLACYLHDVNWEYYRDKTLAKDSPFPPHQMFYFSRLGLRSLEVADLVFTSTQFNKSRFTALRPQCRTEVIGIGFDDPPQKTRAHYGKDILAYISPYPHKRSDLIIPRLSAWLAQRPDAQDIRIHLIGKKPQGFTPPSPQWKEYSHLPFADLQALIRDKCRVSLYFSDYEGFGMPPVESLRMGIPCLASDLPPIRENIPARYLVSNDDAPQFITTLNALYDNPHTDDTPVYPTWEQVAQRALDAMLKAP